MASNKMTDADWKAVMDKSTLEAKEWIENNSGHLAELDEWLNTEVKVGNTSYNEYYDGKVNKDNILYINNLNEQGIAYYRNEMKIFCQSSSLIKNKKKLIIIDDLDTINDQGQQVFRSTLDKYSNNVHCIASCSNTLKVIDSLQSRMNIIKIKPLHSDKLHNIILAAFNIYSLQYWSINFNLTRIGESSSFDNR